MANEEMPKLKRGDVVEVDGFPAVVVEICDDLSHRIHVTFMVDPENVDEFSVGYPYRKSSVRCINTWQTFKHQ